ncbi:MAG: cell division protein FtsA [Deltaproteobacteria bacterium]|nr:cell division protein FtsA [Deltaproteobacteria bacterium]
MGREPELVAGLDIGTTKICAVVGEVSSSGVNIVGIGCHPSVGLHKGVVVNIEATVESIQRAVDEAEKMSGCEISNVYAGIAGGHIKGFNSHGVVPIKGKTITQTDVDRVIEAARAVSIPMDREMLHVLPQEYILDGLGGIKNPVGMTGVRLEARIHIVTGAVASAHNIIKCATKAGLDVIDIVLEPIASSEAVLMPDEMEVGTALIDIGGGTTDLAIFANSHIKHTFVLALGGNNLTNDIAIGLRTPIADAEMLKKKYGSCASSKISKEEIIEIPGVGGRTARRLQRQILGEILEPRVEEMFALVQQEIIRARMQHYMAGGLVLTGGAALLDGMTEAAERVFNVPARIGKPHGITGYVDAVNNPMYATGVGLVLYGARRQTPTQFRIRDKNLFERVISRMKRWFKDAM